MGDSLHLFFVMLTQKRTNDECIDVKHNVGQTALHVAVRNGHAEIVTLLLETGILSIIYIYIY